MRHRLVSLMSVLLAFWLSLPGTSAMRAEDPPVPKGDRILSIDVGPAEDGDYDAAFQLARDVGMQEAHVYFQWSDLEPEPGRFDDEFLDIANLYYPANDTPAHVMVTPISTNQKVVPPDLADTPFSDPALIERFQRLLDHVFAKLPDLEMRSLVIGVEVDAYLGTDPDAWRRYERFYGIVADYARSLRPGIKVGVEGQFEGMVGGTAAAFQALNAHSDVVGVSYYPITDDFGARDPSEIAGDFAELVALYPDRALDFFEVGYPSSELLGSSEERQAEFIAEFFKVWDAHADQVKLIMFYRLHEMAPDEVAFYESFYGFSHPRFAAFLGSLGLRTYDGTDKPAFETLRREATARGW